MTERSIQSKVRSLVVGECPNYQTMGPFGTNNYCFIREKSNHGACVFFSDLEAPRCRYFEEVILPLDKELKEIFCSQTLAREIQAGRGRMIRKKCERCPETFLAKSNAQRFCPKCQKWNEIMKNRERQARFQKNQKNTPRLTESNPLSL